MAEETVTQALVTEPQNLSPREYLRFIDLLEGGMPKGTRAYLVYMDGDVRRVQPVRNGASVVRLDTDLIDHLKNGPFGFEQALELREWCNNLLQRNGQAEVNLSTERHDLLTDAAREAALLIDNARVISQNTDHGEFEKSLLLRGHLKRLSDLVGVIGGAVNPDDVEDSDELLRERLYG